MALLQLTASTLKVKKDSEFRRRVAGEYVSLAFLRDWTVDLCRPSSGLRRDAYDNLAAVGWIG
jgi:hypothetical protein